MAARPDLIDEAERRQLPDNPASLTDAFVKGARTFEQAGGPNAYFGSPQMASTAEGATSFETMAEALVAAIEDELSARS
jgi:creatinine amidohydrolase